MLGFATVDLSPKAGEITVWLTSRTSTVMAGHTNAVVFKRRDLDPKRVRGMLWDRRIVRTPRTPQDFLDEAIPTCDLEPFGQEVTQAQRAYMEQFEQHRRTTRNANLAEPTWLPAPDQAVLHDGQFAEGQSPAKATLVVANLVRQTWSAWLDAEQERVTRRYIEPKGPVRELPPTFEASTEAFR